MNAVTTAGDATRLELELENFLDIFRRLQPHTAVVEHPGFTVASDSVFFNRVAGGDHVVHVDFDRRYDLERRIERALAEGRPDVAAALERNRDRVGVLLADVSGHSITDALVAAMLHQAFLTGLLYELDHHGTVTTRLFENLNTRFHKSVSIAKYISLIYGEISDAGTFRFICAGQPRPLVFSAEYDRFVPLDPARVVGFFPLGMFPSEDDIDRDRRARPPVTKRDYSVNQLELMGSGDVLLLFTDGLGELAKDGERYVEERLERRLRTVKGLPAQDILAAIRDDALAFATPDDDLSLVVIAKR